MLKSMLACLRAPAIPIAYMAKAFTIAFDPLIASCHHHSPHVVKKEKLPLRKCTTITNIVGPLSTTAQMSKFTWST